MRKYFLLSIILFLSLSTNAQYINYSQFYSSPHSLNPALSGSGEYGRVGFIYRNQWPLIDNGYQYFTSWVDYNLSSSNFSIGMNFSNEKQGITNLTTSHISSSLAYEINLNYNWIFRSGIQISFANSNFNSQDFLFYDQFSQGGLINLSQENLSNFDKVNYINLAIGLIAYSKNIWFGSSIYNLPKPNISFSGKIENLERLFSFHGGYNFLIRDTKNQNISIVPAFNYRIVSNINQLDLGSFINFTPILLGIWYRGIPISSNNNIESLIGILGIKNDDFNISYTYDYSLSKLKGLTGGAHEISLVYQFNFLGKKLPPKNVRMLQCPIPNF
mgnify:FL=1